MSKPSPTTATRASDPHSPRYGHKRAAGWIMAVFLLTLGACSSGPDGRRIGSHPPVQGGYKIGVPYQIKGVWYYPKENFKYDKTGVASWYGHPFHGRTSASGERYDMNALTAAHKTLPMPSLVEVTNLENGRRAVLRINDRGPFVSGRIIDVSRAAAKKLGFRGSGIVRVRVRILEQESRRMKQLALANMNGRANALAARRQREADSGPQLAAKPPQYQPVAQPVERSAARPPERLPARPVERKTGTPAASGQGETIAAVPVAEPKPADRIVAARPARKRGGIEVSDLPARGGARNGAGQGVYRPQTATGPARAAGTHASAPGRTAGRHDRTARPKASGIHTARPVAPQVAVRRPAPRPRRAADADGALPGRIFVQAGAFRDRGNASRLRSRLAGIGRVQIVSVRVGGARYFRVRVGPVVSASQGNRLLARVVGAGYPRAQIVID